ncbi:MAG: NAD(P)H-hydrate dehydratase [Clostridia bacterium]|jgi:hydroxyethylthiazole kinase-like uncharacterized protein yjeF|nr:NAD(P)H-hydrate dehydratase [Clostridiaceae bacterium]
MIILTPEQMNRLDEYVINKLNIPGTVLMEHAALAVAEKVEKMVEGIPEPKAVLFVGTGNNGGDGFAAARILESKGIKTVTCLFGDPEKIKGDARVNYDIHKAMGLTLLEYGKDRHEEFVRNVQEADLAVDALMGTGFSGTPRYPIDEAIHILNGYAKKVLSVDIPSGVNGTDGSVSTCCVQADETVTFCCLKPGLCLYPGRGMAGNVTVVPIQIPKQAVERMNSTMHFVDADLAREWLPLRKVDGNKGDYGRLTIITGTGGMTGASVLAAKAAYRTGSGLVYLLTDKKTLPVFETTAIEAVKIPIESDSLEEEFERLKSFLDKQDCLVIGPGMGNNERTFRIVRYFLNTDKNIVLDADGLNVLEGKTELLKTSKANIVITPHPGEMSRLCGKSIGEIQMNRLKAAGDFAAQTGVTVVLKGAGTVISSPEGIHMINSTGSAGLSVAGSGDVLSGMIGSLMGQGLPTLKACALGVYLHGLAGEYAADQFTEYGVTASDIIELIPSAYKGAGKNYNRPAGVFDLTCT